MEEGGREEGRGGKEDVAHVIEYIPCTRFIKLTFKVECIRSTHLNIVVWRGHGEVEHARRDVHAVGSHCRIPVCPNVAKMVVSAVVVVIEWT